MISDLWAFEKKARDMGRHIVAGIDEAGRGPLAGPVVSAAVILPDGADLPGIDDSKKLTPSMRSRLYDRLYTVAIAIGIGVVDTSEIDRVNILQATLHSMAMECRVACRILTRSISDVSTTPIPMAMATVYSRS